MLISNSSNHANYCFSVSSCSAGSRKQTMDQVGKAQLQLLFEIDRIDGWLRSEKPTAAALTDRQGKPTCGSPPGLINQIDRYGRMSRSAGLIIPLNQRRPPAYSYNSRGTLSPEQGCSNLINTLGRHTALKSLDRVTPRATTSTQRRLLDNLLCGIDKIGGWIMSKRPTCNCCSQTTLSYKHISQQNKALKHNNRMGPDRKTRHDR